MQRFQSNRVILAATESKKIIRLFNRVARTLVEFETLWYKAWLESIQASKDGLQATILVRHPDNAGQYLVNFDPELLQLIRETKMLSRLGLPLPEIALEVLEQESRLKKSREELQGFLNEFNALPDSLPRRLRPLLSPHLADLDRLIRPGILTITWQSMNIDGYVHRINRALLKILALVSDISKLEKTDINYNLIVVRKMVLVDFPDEGQFGLAEFVAMQDEAISIKGQTLVQIRDRIDNGIESMLQCLRSYEMETEDQVDLDIGQIDELKRTYSDLFYLAMLGAVKNSFAAIKKRLANRARSRFSLVDQPFFDVDVLLMVPKIQLQPSLDHVQEAINSTARLVLHCVKMITPLGMSKPDQFDSLGGSSYFDRIMAEKDVVLAVVLLTGAVEGTRRATEQHLQTFDRFEFLWTEDKAEAFDQFLQHEPTVDDYETELARYMEIESQIHEIEGAFNLSSMCLRSQSLKYSLKAEASAWKAQFARTLHAKAKHKMEEILDYFLTSLERVAKEVSNFDDVGNTIKWLQDLWEREAGFEHQIKPIENIYSVLRKFCVRLPKDETVG